MADSNKDKLSKIKQKKKDVIQIEKTIEIPKEEKNQEEKNQDGPIIEEVKTELPESNSNLPQEEKKISDKVSENDQNNSTLQKILFKIQLLLSMTNKLDSKISLILSQILSEDHLKCILEERDCRNVCGNILCGEKLKGDKSKKTYYYNSNVKDFRKENAMDFFCDVRCFQKFKDLTSIAQKFDFLRLLNVETIFALSILNEFYPKNKYLEEISLLSRNILNQERNYLDNKEFFENVKKKYEKFFTEEVEEGNKIDINQEVPSLDSVFK
jgi:hypothetical protein